MQDSITLAKVLEGKKGKGFDAMLCHGCQMKVGAEWKRERRKDPRVLFGERKEGSNKYM